MSSKEIKIKAEVPDLAPYIGKTVIIEGKEVKIEHIVGNKITPLFYEINGQHLIGCFRFHTQMEGATDITEEQLKALEEIEYYVEKLDQKEPEAPDEGVYGGDGRGQV